MSVILQQKTTQPRWKVWALYTLIFLLVCFAAYPSLITTFQDASLVPPSRPPIAQQEAYNMANTLWWEADDCQCESKACRKPAATFRSKLGDAAAAAAGGTCGRRAWAAGVGQQVLSFSLFGNKPKYWTGLDHTLQKVKQLYPGWKVRIYTDPRAHAAVLCPLLHRHASLLFLCDIYSMSPALGNLASVNPMLWRVLPMGDPQVDAMMVRDTDSQVIAREVAAVQEWLASGKAFHVMRDHPYHTEPVMGGMWGARWNNTTVTEMRRLRDKILWRGVGGRRYGRDQHVFKEVLWPAMAGRVVAHDSYHCERFKGSSPFPTQRTDDKKFVSFRYHEPSALGDKPCPEACRPPAHRDWLQC